MREYVTLNPLDVKEKFPRSYNNIKIWLSKTSVEGQFLTEEMLNAFIYGNPRFLYDYFDDNQAIVSIYKKPEGFFYNFVGEEESIAFTSRNKAEMSMIYEGLKIMEHKLK